MASKFLAHDMSAPVTSYHRQIIENELSIQAELQLQVMQLRDHAIGAMAQVGELRAQLHVKEAQLHVKEVELERRKTQITRLRNSLDQQDKHLRATYTWRIGSFILLPVRILRQLLRNS